MLRFCFVKTLIVSIFFCAAICAQEKSRVEVYAKIKTGDETSKCEEAEKFLLLPKPNYPKEAKISGIGGSVEIEAVFDEKGKLLFVKNIFGHKELQEEAINAAQKAKFKTFNCKPANSKISALLTYNFLPDFSTKKYFIPAKTEELLDVNQNSRFYEAVFDLTENYKLLYAFEDKRFYPDAPLTSGDFAQYLRATLDFVFERASESGKNPREINLFFSYNPKNLSPENYLQNFDKNRPFADAFPVLLSKYDVDLTKGENKISGSEPLSVNEVIEWWKLIFGAEALPVNFQLSANERRLMTRGDFAVFLDESLQVLAYKVLP